MMAHQYRNDIVIPIVFSYATEFAGEFHIIDDNAKSYNARKVDNFLFD